MRIALAAFVLVMGMFVGGCDSGDDGVSCSSAYKSVCARACECGGTECALGGQGGTLSFDSQADCEVLYVGLGCAAGTKPDVDWNACQPAIDEAQCGESWFATPAQCLEQEENPDIISE